LAGNRLPRDGRGTAPIDRFERDVASAPAFASWSQPPTAGACACSAERLH